MASYRLSLKAVEEEIHRMERNVSGNVRPIACTGPPKRLAQTASHARPSNVLRFAIDQQGYRQLQDVCGGS